MADSVSWPTRDPVVTSVNFINRSTTGETEYYGPFTTLLTTLFPLSEYYCVAPRSRVKDVKGSRDFAVYYLAKKRKVPVFFLDVRTHLASDHDSSRKQADDHVRDRFSEFASGSLPLPKLYGISALGTRYAVYEYRTHDRTLTPTRILPHPEIANDIAPRERLDYDILEPEGETKFKQLVGEIKEMVTSLPDFRHPSKYLRNQS